MPLLVQFGAGNIGRSFIAPLFANGGYEVVFIDVNASLVEQLNTRGEYPVRILDDEHPEEFVVRGVRAIDGRDVAAVAQCLADSDIVATSVGAGALPYLYPVLAQGLLLRQAQYGDKPLDIILAENLRHAAEVVRAGVQAHLPVEFPQQTMLGLVETSIGKMAPLLTEAQRREDPLLVCAEAYNTLILDALAFRNAIPQIAGLYPTPHMAAYVDRKLFIHNLGHAAAAYLGYQYDASLTYIWQAMAVPTVRIAVQAAMEESAAALLQAYPTAFTREDLTAHIADLLLRFSNTTLGDTIYRVGRDLPRKLSRDDRLIGALLFDQRYKVPYSATLRVIAAALSFGAIDEEGQRSAQDQEFMAYLAENGAIKTLEKYTGLQSAIPEEERLLQDISNLLTGKGDSL